MDNSSCCVCELTEAKSCQRRVITGSNMCQGKRRSPLRCKENVHSPASPTESFPRLQKDLYYYSTKISLHTKLQLWLKLCKPGLQRVYREDVAPHKRVKVVQRVHMLEKYKSTGPPSVSRCHMGWGSSALELQYKAIVSHQRDVQDRGWPAGEASNQPAEAVNKL